MLAGLGDRDIPKGSGDLVLLGWRRSVRHVRVRPRHRRRERRTSLQLTRAVAELLARRPDIPDSDPLAFPPIPLAMIPSSAVGAAAATGSTAASAALQTNRARGFARQDARIVVRRLEAHRLPHDRRVIVDRATDTAASYTEAAAPAASASSAHDHLVALKHGRLVPIGRF